MLCRFVTLLLLTATAHAADLRCITWNVESGGTDPAVIAQQLGDLPKVVDFALLEVHGDDLGRYGQAIREAHGRSYRYFASWTGQSNRMLVAFDESKLTLLEWRELFRYGDHQLNDWRHRSPLVCLFEDRATGERFYFLTAHLARGDANLRTSQARGRNERAENVSLPAIVAGDLKPDYDFSRQRGNAAFDAFAGGAWKWAKPDKLIDTNWTDADGDGADHYLDSCLDFAFYAGLLDGWQVTSQVVVRPGDFSDDRTTSDHRPVYVVIATGGAAEPEKPASSLSHWSNTSTGVRHNAGCRNFKNTKRGRMCAADNGRPCGICGG